MSEFCEDIECPKCGKTAHRRVKTKLGLEVIDCYSCDYYYANGAYPKEKKDVVVKVKKDYLLQKWKEKLTDSLDIIMDFLNFIANRIEVDNEEILDWSNVMSVLLHTDIESKGVINQEEVLKDIDKSKIEDYYFHIKSDSFIFELNDKVDYEIKKDYVLLKL